MRFFLLIYEIILIFEQAFYFFFVFLQCNNRERIGFMHLWHKI